MKKVSLLLACAALLFASCAKEQVPEPAESAETIAVSFTAALSSGAATKASSDNDGTGIHADRCKLQVWWNGKVFYEATAEVSGLKAKFENIILIKDQTYDFLFWADSQAGAYYNITDLTRVEMAGTYIGGNDKRDAFYAALADKTVTETFSQNVLLYRPFAQLNVIATDIPALRAQFTDYGHFISSVPEEVSLAVTVPTVFNVKTGAVSEPKKVTYTAPVYASPYKTGAGARNTLSMDYFLAPAEEGNVVEVGFSAKNETSGINSIDYTFSNVPLRRNYRTNILGSLLTVEGTVNVEIKPAWIDEINHNPAGQQ